MSRKPTYEELEQRVKELEKEASRSRQAEEEMRASEEKFFKAFHSGPLLMSISSIKDGRYLDVNERFISITGYSRKETIGTTSVELGLISPDDRETLKNKLLENGHIRDMELALHKKNGETIYCLYCGEIITVGGKQKLLSIAQDITGQKWTAKELRRAHDELEIRVEERTNELIRINEQLNQEINERKQAEEQLRLSEERYRTVYDVAPLAFVVWDCNCLVTDWNKRAEEMFGWSADEVLGRNFFEFLIPKGTRPHVEQIVEALLTGTLPSHSINENLTKSGEIILCEWNNSILYDNKGHVRGAISLALDITDRKRAEEALLESEKRLSQIIHGNSVATFVIDNNHKITHWNMACEKLTGVSAEEMLGTQNQWGPFYNKKRPVMADLVVDNAPDDKITEYYSSKYQCSTIIEGAYEGEDFFPQVGDTGKWLFFTAAPLKDANGKIFGAIEIFQDITGRKLAEEALRQSEEKFRSIFEITGAAITTFLPEGNFLEVNPALCKLLGYTEAELLNLKVEDITHPDDRNRTRLSYDEIKAGQRQSFNYEKRYLCKDGSTVWGHVDVACVFGTTSKPMYCVGLMQDITAGKLAEVALQSSRKMLQAVLDTIPVRVFWKDRDLRYLGCNINFAKDAGLDLPEAIIGKDDYQLSWREQAEMYRADDRQIIESGIPKLNYEEPMVWPDGTSLWLKTSKIPLQDNLGNIFGVLGCYEDITERKKMEQALQTAHDELEKRVEKRTAQLKVTHDQLLHSEKLSAIGKLSASIAHEFNNPLFGIRNVLGGIKKRADLDEEDAELVDMALQECDRIKYLIHDLRDFNRPTSGVMAPMDMHEAIDSILLLLKKEFKNKKIKVQKDYTAKMPNICAVGDQMKQVLLNMLNNASDAISASGGTITIITHLLNKMIAIHIQDTGAGIKPEDMDHIFEPFFTTKPEVKGTGLGLSVSYGIIKRHGGRIDVNSEVGKGSIFTIILPIEEAS